MSSWWKTYIPEEWIHAFSEHIWNSSALMQLGYLALSIALGYILARAPRTQLHNILIRKFGQRLASYNEEALLALIAPAIIFTLLWIGTLIASAAELPVTILNIASKLLTAWVVIRLTSALLRYPAWSRIVAVIAWTIAALSITGMLEPVTHLLDDIAFEIGSFRLSLLGLIKGGISLLLLLWLANSLSRLLDNRIRTFPNITPSVQVLLSKIVRILLIALAVLIGLDSLGIDLTALTVFGGAIGLGLGFGLQKVVSNLISGLILLLDRSVKPGDVIEVAGTFGWVNSLGARYVSVLTRDGFEHLIPNEHLITEKVVNWSYSSPQIRLKIPIGISYGSDVRQAMELILDAANKNPRVLKAPEAVCRLVEFGDSAINLELRIWINDPTAGVINVRSDILLSVWDHFKEHGIEIPFPQQDMHLKPSKELIDLLKKST